MSYSETKRYIDAKNSFKQLSFLLYDLDYQPLTQELVNAEKEVKKARDAEKVQSITEAIMILFNEADGEGLVEYADYEEINEVYLKIMEEI